MVCFQTKNPIFLKILEGLAMEDVGIFYGDSVYFMEIRYTLWRFGILLEIRYTLWPFGII
jgi:hypothetical protein